MDIRAKLKGVSLFKGFDDATIQTLSQGLSFRYLAEDEILFRQTESADVCYIVSFGGVKLYRQDPQGREMIMGFCRPGDFVAAGVMVQTNPRFPVSAIPIEDSGLIQIPRKVYVDVWQNIGEVARAVNLTVMHRMFDLQEDKTLALSPVAIRIANFLLRSLSQQPQVFGNTISLRLSRKTIAESVSTSPETVIRILSQWTQNGWILTEGQRITLVKKSALDELIQRQDGGG